eukprot:757745-Hanusia_phi.AAC.8
MSMKSAALKHKLSLTLERIRQNDPGLVFADFCHDPDETRHQGLQDEDVLQLWPDVATNTYLRVILLSGNVQLTDKIVKELEKILDHNQTLENVDLEFTGVSDMARERLYSTFFQKRLHALHANINAVFFGPHPIQAVNLSNSHLNNSQLQALADCLGRQRAHVRLDLSGNLRIDDEGMKHLNELIGVRKRVVHINLKGTAVSIETQQHILRTVREVEWNLQVHVIEQNDPRVRSVVMPAMEIGFDKVNRLCQGLSSNSSLTSLDMRQSTINEYDLEQILRVLERCNPKIVEVKMNVSKASTSFQEIYKQQVLSLTNKALRRKSDTLTKLDMSFLNLTDHDVVNLAILVRIHSKVKFWNLSNNQQISDKCSDALVKACDLPSTLDSIGLENTKISNEVKKKIKESIRRQKADDLRSFLKQANIADETIDMISTQNVSGAQIQRSDAKESPLNLLKLICTMNASFRTITELINTLSSSLHQIEADRSLFKLEMFFSTDCSLSPQERNDLRKQVMFHNISATLLDFERRIPNWVDLSDLGLDDDGLKFLAEQLQPSASQLHLTLDLSNNPSLGKSSEYQLLRLVNDNTNIVNVRLRRTAFSHDFHHRMQLVFRERSLKCLDKFVDDHFDDTEPVSIDFLAGQHLKSADIVKLSKVLTSCQVLDLDLSESPELDDNAAKMLESSIDKSSVLSQINLSKTTVSSKLCCLIKQKIDKKVIQDYSDSRDKFFLKKSSMDLRDRNMKDDDFFRIIQSLPQKPFVASINLRGNMLITDQSVTHVENFIKNNFRKTPLAVNFEDTNVSHPEQATFDNIAGAGIMEMLQKQQDEASNRFDDVLFGIDQIQTKLKHLNQSIENHIRTSSATLLNLPKIADHFNKDDFSIAFQIQNNTNQTACKPKKRDSGSGRVGIRLKFDYPVTLSPDALSSILGCPKSMLETTTVGDRIVDVLIFKQHGSEQGLTVDLLTEKMFSFCDNARSEFCIRYNRGREILCMYPWAVKSHQRDESEDYQEVEESNFTVGDADVCKGKSSFFQKIFQYLQSTEVKLNSMRFQSQEIQSMYLSKVRSLFHDVLDSLSKVKSLAVVEEVSRPGDDEQMLVRFVKEFSWSVKKQKDPFVRNHLHRMWTAVKSKFDAFEEYRKQDYQSLDSAEITSIFQKALKETKSLDEELEAYLKSQRSALQETLKKKQDVERFDSERKMTLQVREKQIASELKSLEYEQDKLVKGILDQLEKLGENTRKRISLKQEVARIESETGSQGQVSEVLEGALHKEKVHVAIIEDLRASRMITNDIQNVLKQSMSDSRQVISEDLDQYNSRMSDFVLRHIHGLTVPMLCVSLLEQSRKSQSIHVDLEEIERVRSNADHYQQLGKVHKVSNVQSAWEGNESELRMYFRNFRLVLAMDISAIRSIENFKSALAEELGEVLGIEKRQVEILSVLPGSVIVDLRIHNKFPGQSEYLDDVSSHVASLKQDEFHSLRTGSLLLHVTEFQENDVVYYNGASIETQKLELSNLAQSHNFIMNELSQLWQQISKSFYSVFVCRNSDDEIMLQFDRVKQTFVCVLGIRVLQKSVSWDKFAEMVNDDNPVPKYLKAMEASQIVQCTQSDQFQREYQKAQEDHAAMEDSNRFLREEERAVEQRITTLRRNLSECQESLATLTDRETSLQNILSQKETDARLSKIALEVYDKQLCEIKKNRIRTFIQTRDDSVTSQRVLDDYVKRLERLFKKHSLGFWKSQTLPRRCATIQKEISVTSQRILEAEKSLKFTVKQIDGEESRLSTILTKIMEMKSMTERKRIVLLAYQHLSSISDGRRPRKHRRSDFLVKRNDVEFLTNLHLVTNLPYAELNSDKLFCEKVQGELSTFLGKNLQMSEKLLRQQSIRPNTSGMAEFHVVLYQPPDQLANNLAEAFLSWSMTRIRRVPSRSIEEKLREQVIKVTTATTSNKIGEGQLGDVLEAEYLGRPVAVKFIRFSGMSSYVAKIRFEPMTGEIQSHIAVLCSLHHPNILQYQGMYWEQKGRGAPDFAIVMERASSSLFDVIARNSALHHKSLTLSELELEQIFRAMDVSSSGRVTQSMFVRALEKHEWIVQKLSLSVGVLQDDCLRYIWNYGIELGSLEEPPKKYHHPFGRIDRDAKGYITLQDLLSFYGRRELVNDRIAWPQRLQVALAIASGMAYLHDRGIVHGLLNSKNVAIIFDGGGNPSGTWNLCRVAVTDYGLPFLKRNFELMPDLHPQHAAWVPPEMLLGEDVEMAGDVWSFGVILWELMTGFVPWPGKTREDLTALATNKQLALPMSFQESHGEPPGYHDVMNVCMQQDKQERPNMRSVLQRFNDLRASWSEDYLPA